MIQAVQVRDFGVGNSHFSNAAAHTKSCCQKIKEVIQKIWGAIKNALNALLKPYYRCWHNYTHKIKNIRDHNFFERVQKEARLLPPDQLTKGLLFEIRDNAGASKGYLLGTVHALQLEHHHWHPSIFEKFHESTHLGVEGAWYEYDANLENNRAARSSIDEFFNDPSLDQNALAYGSEQLRLACVRLGKVTDTVLQQQEQRVQGAIRSLPANEANKKKNRMNFIFYTHKLTSSSLYPGADDRLLAAAQRFDKPVIYLENEDIRNEYLKLMYATEYRPWFGKNVDEITRLASSKMQAENQTVEAWKRGDFVEFCRLREMREGDAFIRHAQDPILLGFIRRKRDVFRDRNIQMANTVDQFIRRGQGKFFAAFGSAHLVGQTGVNELLRQRGWTVEQVGAPQIQFPEVPLQAAAGA